MKYRPAFDERMARIGAAFDMKVIARSPHLTAERAPACGAVAVDNNQLFSASDVVFLHLVSSDTTRGIIDRAALQAMQPHAWLVNTSRSLLVDRQALLEALRDGRIAGAGLDVFDTEPVPTDDAQPTLPNVLTSPHLGYVTDDNLGAFYRRSIDAIAAWQAGAPIRVLTPAAPPSSPSPPSSSSQ